MAPDDPGPHAPEPASRGVEVRSGRSRAERIAAEGDDARARLVEAAIQAELATGTREKTEEAAKRHILLRLGAIVLGFVVLIAGLAMMVFPGPGIPVTIAGLAILATELPWAARLLEYVKKRARVDELKEQPRWVRVAVMAGSGAAMVGSVVYFLVLR